MLNTQNLSRDFKNISFWLLRKFKTNTLEWLIVFKRSGVSSHVLDFYNLDIHLLTLFKVNLNHHRLSPPPSIIPFVFRGPPFVIRVFITNIGLQFLCSKQIVSLLFPLNNRFPILLTGLSDPCTTNWNSITV